MKKGNLVRIKQIPDIDVAGNPREEHLGVYLGEETIHTTTVYEVLVLGESKPHRISSNYWELETI
tara:strand:+ start:400 stop:594 length:195 start_codon:yes stop_codon:yes gene_type:complete